MTSLSSFAGSWPAVSALLDVVLGLPATEREAWIERLAGEQAVHRETLRALLARQGLVETGDFLGDLPVLDMRAPEPTAGRVAAGSRVGAYRLVAEIGAGGMGTVWAADRADGLLTRRVALKLPHVVWGDVFAERLAREREILATLDHEHIARLHDAGVDAQGRPYLAMEFVSGEPIDVFCRSRSLSVRERIALLLQVMEAVSHAHARLVVHRDLKPSNILVSGEGQVKLLDFGIAKLLEAEGGRSSELTQRAGLALTPDYASPEQIRGEPLGTGSDVYALGVVAYEMLTGTRPYRLKRGSAAEIEEAIATAEPRLASDAATSPDARHALRGDLDAVLRRALEKGVTDRYASVDAFADDLRRHLRGDPVQARPDSRLYRATRFVGRNRLAVSMTAALLASIAAGAVVSVWQAQVARAEERRASVELDRQRAILDLYLETLSRLSVLASEDPKAMTARGAVTTVLQDKLREMGPRYANRPDERAAQLQAVMLQLNYDNRFDDSLAVGQTYLAHLQANGGSAAQVINTYCTLGRTLFQLHRYDESEAMRRAGMLWAPDADDHDTITSRMQAATDLGGLLTMRGKRTEARAVLTGADAEMARRYPNEHVRYEKMSQFAIFDFGFDDDRALKWMQQSHKELLEQGGADPDTLANNDWLLGSALLANGRVADAESALTESLAIYRREYGRDSRNAVRAFARLMSAVSRRDPVRAETMIDAERQALTAQPEGLSRYADLSLSARSLEAAWLAGDTASAIRVSVPPDADLMAESALRDNELLLIQRSRALFHAGDVHAALRLMQALHRRWPERSLPTAPWLRIEEALAEAQLEAKQNLEAAATAGAVLRLLEQEGASAGKSYHAAAALAALAEIRSGHREESTRLLALAARSSPAFPSAAEQADVDLNRAQALSELGRNEEAATLARTSLSTLSGQNAASPRLALARRLAGETRI